MHPTIAPFFRSNEHRGVGRSDESVGGSETQKYVFSVAVASPSVSLLSRDKEENE
jgi:hypothetical protein